MEYIDYELEDIENIRNSFELIIDECILSLKDEIRKLIKERWLKGESVDGGSIGEYLSSTYKKLKLNKNPKARGRVDLTLTGSLGNEIDIVRRNNGDYEIISNDSKYNSIGSKYGFKEFGLTKEQDELINTLVFMKIENKLINL